MTEETQSKWEGKATVELKSPRPDQIWPFIADFCNLHKWHPDLDTCYQVEGEPGQPGLVRYCSTTASQPSAEGETNIIWVKEKLLMIDPIERCLSYNIVENNMGFKSYVATFRVLAGSGSDGGCEIEWCFVADPIEGWTLEDLTAYCNSTLEFMAKKMEQAVLCNEK